MTVAFNRPQTIRAPLVDQNTIRRRGIGLRALNHLKVSMGYTLFTPLTGQGEVYLMDIKGRVVHEWKLPYPPGLYGYLLPNGNLFYNGKIQESQSRFPLWKLFKGGVVLEVDRHSNIVWEYHHPDHHHDACRLRNGNTLILCLEKIPRSLAAQVKGGIPNTEADGEMYADVIHEVTPGGEIIWSWHAYEHLDPATDIINPQDPRHEWTHGNSVRELADGNIVLTALNYSRVIEVDRQTQDIVWEYTDNPPQNFFSPYISGAQRLPNGNTLITEGSFGRLFEVTPDGEVVWEYVNPHFGLRSTDSSPVVGGDHNSVFRAFRYTREEIPWL